MMEIRPKHETQIENELKNCVLNDELCVIPIMYEFSPVFTNIGLFIYIIVMIYIYVHCIT